MQVGKEYILHTEHVMLIPGKSKNSRFRKILYVQNKQLFLGIENMYIFLTGGMAFQLIKLCQEAAQIQHRLSPRST